MAQQITDSHWRDSARSVKFLIWDAKTAFPLVFFAVYISWWTLGISIATMVFFSILKRYGFTMAVFGRWLRNLLAGSHKDSRPRWMQ